MMNKDTNCMWRPKRPEGWTEADEEELETRTRELCEKARMKMERRRDALLAVCFLVIAGLVMQLVLG